MIIFLFIVSQWMTFLSSREVYDMVSCGDTLLIGTTGGALIFNKKGTSFTRITNVDGLLSNKVCRVDRDPYGNFWFLCSGGGITLMRGNKLRNFTSMENLPSYELTSMCIDGDTVWAGTSDDKKVWMFDMQGDPFVGGSAKLFDIEPTNKIEVIEVIGDSIWFGTHNGIGVMKKGESSFRVYNTDSGLPNDTVLAITSWGGYIWAGTMKGTARRGPSGWEVVDSSYWCPSENDTIWMKTRNFCFNDTSLWEGTSSGTKKWDGWGFNPILDDFWWDSRKVLCDSILWIGTFGNGVAKFDGSLSYYIPEGPASSIFASITIDMDKNLWGTHNGGHGWAVSKLYQDGDEWKWKIHNSNNEWGIGIGGMTKEVLADRENNIWVTMWGYNDIGVVKVLPNDSIIKFRIGGSNANCILSRCLDRDGNLWIGCWDGCIRRIRNDIVDTVISNDYTRRVQALMVEPNGNLWVGDQENGLWIFLKEEEFSRVSGISGDEEIKFINSFGKEVWVGTSGGEIYQVEDKKVVRNWTKVKMGGITQNVAKDPEGGIWFAIEDVGVKRLNPDGTWTQYGVEDGLSDKKPTCLGFDEKLGVLWIGTVQGLSRFETEISLPKFEVTVYPNPFVLSKHKEKEITFKEVCNRELEEINIYTLSGRKVRSIRGATSWDVRNESNEFVASGVYIFVVYIEGGEHKIGKIAIVR